MELAEISPIYMSVIRKKQIHPFQLVLLLIMLSLASCIGSKNTLSDAQGLKKKQKKVKIDGVVRSTKSYMGTPYKWGGTTRAGMDCSGLLYTSYKQNGITIPRTSAEQQNIGRKVSIKKLKKGDWVFFAAGKKKKKITHVGLVTRVVSNEKIMFIHASSSLGVVENNIFSNYYRKIFVKAMRPF